MTHRSAGGYTVTHNTLEVPTIRPCSEPRHYCSGGSGTESALIYAAYIHGGEIHHPPRAILRPSHSYCDLSFIGAKLKGGSYLERVGCWGERQPSFHKIWSREVWICLWAELVGVLKFCLDSDLLSYLIY